MDSSSSSSSKLGSVTFTSSSFPITQRIVSNLSQINRCKKPNAPLGSLNRTYKTCQFTNPCCLTVLASSSCTKDTIPPRAVSFLHSSKSLSDETSGSATSSPPCKEGTDEDANWPRAESASALMSGRVAVREVVRKMAVLWVFTINWISVGATFPGHPPRQLIVHVG